MFLKIPNANGLFCLKNLAGFPVPSAIINDGESMRADHLKPLFLLRS